MIEKSISLDNIIRVNIAETPTNLATENVNVIAIFTNEKSQYPIDKYVIYKSINGVAEMWGLDSNVYKMINNIYSQSLNITAGQGYVVVFQLKDNVEIPATSGSLLTQNIIYSKFLTVKDGAIGINVDGTIYNLQDIDFSTCQDLDMIVNYLNNLFTTNNIPATVYNVNQEIKIISNTSGASSKVELIKLQTVGQNLGGEKYFDIANSTYQDGENEIPAIPATPTSLTTITLSLTSLQSTSNGVMTIRVDDGVEVIVGSIDFTSIITFEDAADVLQTKLTEASVANVIVSTIEDKLVFTTTSTGASSNVRIAPSSGVTGATDLYFSFNIANATYIKGTDEIPAVPATAGTYTTADINIENFKLVNDGGFKIIIDGTSKDILNCNFTSINTIEDIATILTNKTNINVVANNNKLIFTSNTTGASSTIRIENLLEGTDLTTLDYFNIDKCILVNGTDAYTGNEKLSDAVIRCKELTFFEAILTTYIPSDIEIEETATTIQTLNKMYFVVKNNLNNLDIFNTIKQKRLTKTRCLYYGGSDYLLFTSGYTSKLLSVNFNGNNTANNLNNKEIIGLLPDITIGDTELNILKDMGIDCYCNMRNLGVIQCSGENQWADTVLFINWIQNALQVVGFNTLRNNLRIKQTEAGVQVLIDNYKTVLEQAITSGYIAPNKWNGAIYFGNNEEIYKNNILQNGYYIYTEPVANQSQEERRKRIAPPCYIAIKLSGAINEADLTIFMED